MRDFTGTPEELVVATLTGDGEVDLACGERLIEALADLDLAEVERIALAVGRDPEPALLAWLAARGTVVGLTPLSVRLRRRDATVVARGVLGWES